MLAFVAGTTNLGIAIGFPPALSMLTGISAGVTQLFYIVFTNQSPTGLPGVSGPPLPAKVLLTIIESTLLSNAFCGFVSGYYSDVSFMKFVLFLIYGISVPMILAMMLRQQG